MGLLCCLSPDGYFIGLGGDLQCTVLHNMVWKLHFSNQMFLSSFDPLLFILAPLSLPTPSLYVSTFSPEASQSKPRKQVEQLL